MFIIPIYIPIAFISGYIGYYYGQISNINKYKNALSFVDCKGKYINKKLSPNGNINVLIVDEKYNVMKITDNVSYDVTLTKEELFNEIMINYINLELSNSDIINIMNISENKNIESQIERIRNI